MKRILSLAAALVAAAVHAAPLPGWAADAGPGGRQWDPSAPLVVLTEAVRVQFAGPDRLFRQERRAVLLRQNAGLPAARLVLPYNPDTDHVRSVHVWVQNPAGNVTVMGRSAFSDVAQNFNHYYWDHQRALIFDRLDALVPGAIVAYEVETESRPGFAEAGFDASGPLPVWSSSFEVVPFSGGQVEWFAKGEALQHPSAGSVAGALRWNAGPHREPGSELPANFLPNPEYVVARVRANPPLTWQGLARLARAVMEPPMAETADIQSLAQSLVAGPSNRWSRIRALTEWVQTQIVYLAISIDRDNLAGIRPHPTGEILRNRYGDCKDKATLLVMMLRAAGEDARLVLVAADAPQRVDEHWPSAAFNHVIVAIATAEAPASWPTFQLAGKTYVLFDPTDPGVPLGLLPLSDQGGWGLLLDETQGGLGRLPPFSDDGSLLQRTIQASLDPRRTLEAQVSDVITGTMGAQANDEYRGLSAADFQARIERAIASTQAAFRAATARRQWSAADSRLRIDVSYSIPRYGERVGSGMVMLSPAIDPIRPALRPWGPRARGRSLLPAESLQVTLRLALPEGVSVEETPDPWMEKVGGAVASVAYRAEARALDCDVRFHRPAGYYDRENYEALRRLCAHLEAQQSKPVLLDVPAT